MFICYYYRVSRLLKSIDSDQCYQHRYNVYEITDWQQSSSSTLLIPKIANVHDFTPALFTEIIKPYLYKIQLHFFITSPPYFECPSSKRFHHQNFVYIPCLSYPINISTASLPRQYWVISVTHDISCSVVCKISRLLPYAF
jgi:hypothetical protein